MILDPLKLQQIADELTLQFDKFNIYIQRCENITSELASINNNMYNATNRLKDVICQMYDTKKKGTLLANALHDISNIYERTEESIINY